ncbi:DUF418 domain-containing protein [Lysobacter tyrosinilyticus]
MRLAQPVPSQLRAPVVDFLRGWALLGVVIGNFLSFYYLGADPERDKDTLTLVLEFIARYLFAAKSWTLLSILFGYGFSVLIGNIVNNTAKPISFFLKRMAWLLAFAFLNSMFFFGDILRDYALLGVFLLLFRKSSPQTLLRTSLLLILVIPFVSAYTRPLGVSFQAQADALIPAFKSHSWLDVFRFNLETTWYLQILNPPYAIMVHVLMLACMLLGVAAHRSNFIHRLGTDPRLVRRIFFTSLALAVVLTAAFSYLNETKAPLLTYFRFGYWGVISTMFAVATGLCWLHGTGRMRVLSAHLQDMGRMTLTHYMVQCVLIAAVFSGAGLGIFNTKPYWFYLILAIGIYTLQVFLSRWWLARFQYGPVEWLWRKLCYGGAISSIGISKLAVPEGINR